jgi:4-hydroxybenzoate polyprenyltransferase
MVSLIAGCGAFAARAGLWRSLHAALAGLLLASGGFALDFTADWRLDRRGQRNRRRRNPVASGDLSPRAGLAFSLSFLAAGLAAAALLSPWALLPAAAIAGVVAALALHKLETPILRLLSLGLLQALYVLLGAASGRMSWGMLLLAGMFFVAMMGGRAMTDIRDYPTDVATPVQTLPKRYGLKASAWTSAALLHLAFALSLAAYATGEFNRLYLYLAIPYVLAGLGGAWLFVLRPSPHLAARLTYFFMMGEGTLICLAMVLGSLPGA